MKKETVLWSSPQADGLTASVKDQFIRGLKDAGADVEEIHLNSRKRRFNEVQGNTRNR